MWQIAHMVITFMGTFPCSGIICTQMYMAFFLFGEFLGLSFWPFFHEIISKFMAFKLHFALRFYGAYFVCVCVYIRDMCEHVKLNAVIQ